MPPASGYIITAILPKITQWLVITAESIGKIPSIIKNRIVHFSSINSIYPTKININSKISLSLGRKEKEIMKKEHIILYTCILLSAINIFIIIFQYYHQQQPLQENKINGIPPAVTADVRMPGEATFAGEAVPLHRIDVQEALRREIIVNSYLHSHTTQILQKVPCYFPIIEPILKANGIPDDFKYLAVIESRLEPLIVSPAGAVGIWQIMKATGKELGLEINNEIDERYHLAKATEAAAKYFRKAYERFGSWTLAAASYNGGQAFISRQMKQQQTQNYYDLLLGEETERYVYRILALKEIITHPQQYNFNIQYANPAEPADTIEVKTSVKDWTEFALQHGITYKTLKRFNPWLRRTELHNPKHKTYLIAIPKNKTAYK